MPEYCSTELRALELNVLPAQSLPTSCITHINKALTLKAAMLLV